MSNILHEIRFGESKSECNTADAAFKIIPIHRLKPRHQISVSSHLGSIGPPRCYMLLHSPLFVSECNDIGKSTAQLIIERIAGKICLLLYITDSIGEIHHYSSAIRLLPSEQDSHECCLSTPIRTDKPNLIAMHHFEVHVGKKCTYAIGLFKSYHLQTAHITLLHPCPRHPADSRGR